MLQHRHFSRLWDWQAHVSSCSPIAIVLIKWHIGILGSQKHSLNGGSIGSYAELAFANLYIFFSGKWDSPIACYRGYSNVKLNIEMVYSAGVPNQATCWNGVGRKWTRVHKTKRGKLRVDKIFMILLHYSKSIICI